MRRLKAGVDHRHSWAVMNLVSSSGAVEPALPLKVLYHHRTRSRDGQSVHIDEMIAALRAAGHYVIVVEPKRVDALKPARGKQVLPKFLYELLEFGYSGLELAKMVGHIIRSRPDAIYERANIFMLSGVWAARFFGLPLLVEVNAPLTEERAKFDGLALEWLARWTEETAWRAADFVLPVTAVLGKYAERAGVPPSRIVVTSNGVDLNRFDAQERTDRSESSSATPTVLGFVGYIREWHGLPLILELMASDAALKDTHLLVVGDGPGRATIERKAQQLGIAERVCVTGIVERDELASYIRQFDVALQPEVTAYASPLKLFEYMALACAIVAPDTENIREILTDQGDSLLFAPNDAKALAQAVRSLVQDPKLRHRLGMAARATLVSNNITWQRNAERAADLIRECLHQERDSKSQAPGPFNASLE